MSFAVPIALTLTALALPIIALYILKVRLRRMPVSTNLFWKQIYDEKPPRSIWQQLRHWSSLLLQLLMLMLLVAAVADPYFSWQILQARRMVIVIDNSASMRATDVKPTRLEAARKAALEIVEGLRFQDEVALILAGAAPEVIVGMTGHTPTLRDAINGVDFSDNPTSLTSAIELGRKIIGDHPHGRVIAMTDGCIEPVDDPGFAALPADAAQSPAAGDTRQVNTRIPNSANGPDDQAPVEYRLFATEASNVGITQLQVRRSLVDPLGYEALASVRNASASPVSCRLEVTLNDIPVDVIPLKLKAEEVWTRSIEKTSLEGGQVKAVLTQFAFGESSEDRKSGTDKSAGTDSRELDMLDTDNSAWALLSGRKIQKVLVVSPGNLFLGKVFEANPLVEVTVRKDVPEEWPAGSVIVLHGVIPSTLPPGNVFVVDPIGNCDLWDQAGVLENPVITEQDTASPLMTHIRLDNVIVPQAGHLQFRTPPHVLAQTLSGEIVYAEVKRPNGKCLVLSVNLDDSDLAFRTTFPIMVANVLAWFSGMTAELQPSIATGSVVALPVRTDASGEILEDVASNDGSVRAVLQSPSMKQLTVAVSVPSNHSSSTATIGPLDEAGFWQLMPTATGSPKANEGPSNKLTEVAVNLSSERETDLRPLSGLVESSESKTLAAGWFSRAFWFYLVLAGCLLTTLEWFLYQRRFIA